MKRMAMIHDEMTEMKWSHNEGTADIEWARRLAL